MPTYSYHCLDCGARYSAMRKMAQRAESPPCPDCGSARTELGISAPFVASSGAGSSSRAASCSSGFG